MTPMTHERCSELLRAYVQGDIAPDERAEVSAHLDACDACRHEEAGLRSLLATEPGSLDERERAHLRDAVMSAIAASDEETAPSLHKLQRPSKAAFVQPVTNWRARVAGGLAAAAVVVIAGVFYLGGGFSGEDSGDTAGGADGDRSTQQLSRESASTEDRAGNAIPAAGADAESEEFKDSGAGGATTTEGFAEPAPTFIGIERRYTNARLDRLGRRGLQLVLFSRAYDTDDTARLRNDFVDRVATSAARRAGQAAADQVRDCAGVVLDGEATALPAFGALGRLDGRDVLVLGFAWSEGGSGSLDDYMLWTWRRGSCDSLTDYRTGSIRPAD